MISVGASKVFSFSSSMSWNVGQEEVVAFCHGIRWGYKVQCGHDWEVVSFGHSVVWAHVTFHKVVNWCVRAENVVNPI